MNDANSQDFLNHLEPPTEQTLADKILRLCKALDKDTLHNVLNTKYLSVEKPKEDRILLLMLPDEVPRTAYERMVLILRNTGLFTDKNVLIMCNSTVSSVKQINVTLYAKAIFDACKIDDTELKTLDFSQLTTDAQQIWLARARRLLESPTICAHVVAQAKPLIRENVSGD